MLSGHSRRAGLHRASHPPHLAPGRADPGQSNRRVPGPQRRWPRLPALQLRQEPPASARPRCLPSL